MKFSEVNLLEMFKDPRFHELRRAFSERRCAKGEMIYTPWNEVDHIFVLASGKLKVFIASEDKEFIIGILEPGDIYSSHTGAWVEALEEGSVLYVDPATFHRRMMKVPEFTQTMVRVLGRILKNAFSTIEGLVFHDSLSRLAAFLLESLNEDERGAGGHPTIRLGMTGEDLARHLGTTRQTVSTLLSDLVRSGVLKKRSRGVYRLLDEAKLRDLAAG